MTTPTHIARLTPTQQAAIDDLWRQAREALPIEAVVLFGSVARGDADSDSDLDLLLLTAAPLTPAQQEEARAIRRAVNARHDARIMTVEVDREAWLHGPVAALPIKTEIEREGILLYGVWPTENLLEAERSRRLAEASEGMIHYFWSSAEESLAAAQRDFDAGAYRHAVHNLYYAAFYAVSTVLLDRGLRFVKHTGVQTALHRDLIRAGLLNPQWGQYYDDLLEDRHRGDYVAFTSFSREYVVAQLEQTRLFLAALRPLIAAFRSPEP